MTIYFIFALFLLIAATAHYCQWHKTQTAQRNRRLAEESNKFLREKLGSIVHNCTGGKLYSIVHSQDEMEKAIEAYYAQKYSNPGLLSKWK